MMSFVLFSVVSVIKRLERFGPVKESLLKHHKVDIEHYLSDDSDDPILERLDIPLFIFKKASHMLVDTVDDLLGHSHVK